MYDYQSIFQGLRNKANRREDVWDCSFEGAIFGGKPWYLLNQEVSPKRSTETIEIKLKKEIVRRVIPPNSSLKPLVLFVSDYPRAKEELFNEEQKNLFDNIVSAMHLRPTEFACLSALSRPPTDEEERDWNVLAKEWRSQVASLILQHRPKIIISLGATATNLVLGNRERLSVVHGQFFDKTFEDHFCQVIPIFHMDFLLINPSMKKAAWVDLQKAMKIIGK